MDQSLPSISVDELRAESDVTVLQFIAMREDDELVARAAFHIFYERYHRYLAAVVRKVCARFPISAQELTDAVLQNTFMKVFERAETFNPALVRSSEMSAGIKAWLGTIADNEHKRLLEQLRPQAEMMLVVEDIAVFEKGEEYDPDEELDEEPTSYERKLLDAALGTLSEKESYILLQSAAYEQEGKHLPREFISNVCKLFNITRANFRKIKQNARIKILKRIDELRALKK
jgi:RNA polymerase sigma factor (sigma-70 family)